MLWSSLGLRSSLIVQYYVVQYFSPPQKEKKMEELNHLIGLEAIGFKLSRGKKARLTRLLNLYNL